MSDENHHLPLSQKLSQSQTTRRGDSFLLEILSARILVCFLVSTWNRKIYKKFRSLLQVGTRKYTTIKISNWNFLVLVLLTGSTQYPSHLALLINQLMISNQSHIKKFNFLLFMINLFPPKWIEATVEQFTVLWCAVLCSELAYRKHTQIKSGL